MRAPSVFVLSIALWGTGCGLLYDFEERPDAGPQLDAGRSDAGRSDAGPFDAGTPCGNSEDCDPTPLASGCATSVCVGGICVAGDDDLDGLGPGCDRGDCDDADAAIGADALLPCETAGLGVCGRGAARVCLGGVPAAQCVGDSVPTGELCDGLDNDCDGAVDEDISVPVLPGGCAVAEVACVAGAWQVSYQTAPSGDDCSGTPDVDDDCDGSVDESCVIRGECVYVRNIAEPAIGEPTSPRGALGSIESAVAWIAARGDAPRRICLLADLAGNQCIPTRFPGATIPSGVDIQGNLRAEADGAVSRCAGRGATTIDGGDEPVALDVVGTLPGDVGGPSTFSDFDVLIPGTPPVPTVGIHVQVTDRVRLQDLGIRPELPTRTLRSDGVRAGPNSDVVLSDVYVTVRGLLGSAVVAQPGSLLAVNRTTPARTNLGCDRVANALVGGRMGWAIDATDALVRMQRAAICPGGAGGVQLSGGDLAAASSGLLGDTRLTGWTGVQLYGAGGFLADFFVAALTASGTTRYFGAEAGSTLVLTGLETTSPPAASNASSVTIVDCADSACVFASSRAVAVNEPNVAQTVGVDCRGTATCLLHDVELRTNNGAAFESTALRVREGARALVRTSALSGGCGENATGIEASGGALRVERSQVLGTHRCSTGAVHGMKVAPGAQIDALSSSFSSGVDTDGPCGSAVAVSTSAASLLSLRNSVFDGGSCTNAGSATQIDSSPATLLAHCGFSQPASLSVDGSVYTDDVSARAALPAAFGNVYAENPGFGVGYPDDLSISAGSPFAGAGGAGAPPLDLNGQPARDPPAIGAFEP